MSLRLPSPLLAMDTERPARMIPLLDLKAQNRRLRPQLRQVFERIVDSGQFILGQEVASLEEEIASFLQVRQAIGVSSGTDALLLALMALGLGAGDEILCPAFTFFATAGGIARVGAKPIFVDACPVCFNLDLEDAERKITRRTRAILPVHLFGQACAMTGLMELAKQRNLLVIEDGAQSLGARHAGRAAGSFGDFGAFSFFPSKNLSGFGDGGMLVCNDRRLADRARVLRNHGGKTRYLHEMVGGNFRLDALQAGLLRVKLPHYAGYNRQRAAHAAYYRQELGPLRGVRPATLSVSRCLHRGARGGSEAEPAAKIILPEAYPENAHIWNQYTIRVRGRGNRDRLKKYLRERGISAEIYYPRPLPAQPCFAHLAGAGAAYPVAEQLAKEVLSLPVFPELERRAQDEVIGAIKEWLVMSG